MYNDSNHDTRSAPPAAPRRALPWGVIIPAVAFSLVVLVGLGLSVKRAGEVRQVVRERQQINEQLGLPRDYPVHELPLYQGAAIVKAERGEAQSTDGQPMDKWYVHARCDAEPKAIFEYYNDLLLDAGYQQTTYISIPKGYGVNFADESTEVDFVIEQRTGDPGTQLEITIYRLRR